MTVTMTIMMTMTTTTYLAALDSWTGVDPVPDLDRLPGRLLLGRLADGVNLVSRQPLPQLVEAGVGVAAGLGGGGLQKVSIKCGEQDLGRY